MKIGIIVKGASKGCDKSGMAEGAIGVKGGRLGGRANGHVSGGWFIGFLGLAF